MNVSQHGLDFIAGFEGGESSDGLFHAYWDAFGKVWTIGYGETANVHQGMTWTKAQAEAELRASIERNYEPAINALGVALNQNQYDALCSFVWNLGPGSMTWDVGRDVRARNFLAAADAMLQYDSAGGQVLQGLVTRRQAERALFLTPYTSPDPYHYLWLDDTVRHPEATSERGAVEAYDRWRRMQTPHRHPHRANIEHLQDQMSLLANRLTGEIEESHDANSYHRGWRLDQLRERIAGRRLVP
jgi:lysozyme